jgi:hypothetical protein
MLARRTDPTREHESTWVATFGAATIVTAFLGMAVIVGADCLWLVAVGEHILANRTIPDGIPFAAAPSQGWPNVPVLAEILLALLNRLGDSALAMFQVILDLATLGLIAWGARREGASDKASAGVLLLVALGSLTSLVIVRVQMLSLVPFALLLLLLRSEARGPSRRIWLVPPLVAVWSNLHGAVLVGVVVAGTYLVFSRLRRRPVESLVAGAATLVAVTVTPAGLRTLEYYAGVMTNEAAARGSELWARPNLGQPLDLLMVATLTTIVVVFARVRPPVWEWVVVAGLAAGTLTAARHGVWLLLFAAAPAARGLTRRAGPRGVAIAIPGPRALTAMVTLLAVVSVPLVLGRRTLPADPGLVRDVVAVADGRVVLAPEPLAESLAVAGARLWLSDPVDAFAPTDQVAFLDFLEGEDGGLRAVAGAEVVVVEDDSPSARLVEGRPDLVVAKESGEWRVYVRR